MKSNYSSGSMSPEDVNELLAQSDNPDVNEEVEAAVYTMMGEVRDLLTPEKVGDFINMFHLMIEPGIIKENPPADHPVWQRIADAKIARDASL